RGGLARVARGAVAAVRRADPWRGHPRARGGGECSVLRRRGRGQRRRRRAGRRGRGPAHGSRGRLATEWHVAQPALPRLPVTRQSLCIAAHPGRRYRRLMLARRTTNRWRWKWCVSFGLVLCWSLGSGSSAWAWAWPADREVLRGFSVSGDAY